MVTGTMIHTPQARVDDGVLHLLYTKSDTSRFTLIKLLLGFDDGTHMKEVGLSLGYVRATALKICPKKRSEKNPGYVVIDGELVMFINVSGGLRFLFTIEKESFQGTVYAKGGVSAIKSETLTARS